MLRLTALLCAFLFTTMLIGGRDYGQLRPGLAAARDERLTRRETAAETTVDIAAETADAADNTAVVAGRAATDTSTTESNLIEANYAPDSSTIPLVLPLIQVPAAETTAAAPAAAEDPASAETRSGAAVWFVDARSVNVREGPSTDHTVLGKLSRGEAITVLETNVGGWTHILVEGDGVEGFVASKYLTDQDPAAN